MEANNLYPPPSTLTIDVKSYMDELCELTENMELVAIVGMILL